MKNMHSADNLYLGEAHMIHAIPQTPGPVRALAPNAWPHLRAPHWADSHLRTLSRAFAGAVPPPHGADQADALQEPHHPWLQLRHHAPLRIRRAQYQEDYQERYEA